MKKINYQIQLCVLHKQINYQINQVPPQQQQQTVKSSPITNSSTHKSNKCPPANVVVNPLIHHPSFLWFINHQHHQ